MRRQTIEEQIARLRAGLCPVHGLGLGQIGQMQRDGRALSGCPRTGCQHVTMLSLRELRPRVLQ